MLVNTEGISGGQTTALDTSHSAEYTEKQQ